MFRSRTGLPKSIWMTLTVLLIMGGWAYSRPAQSSLPRYPYLEAQAALEGAVKYLDQTQKKSTQGTSYFSGEWESDMRSSRAIPLIGPAGTGGYDSNLFTVASIHNILAAVWLRQPQLEQILPLLDLAIERILTYQNGKSFNFWPLLPPRLYTPKKDEPQLIRRPNHFPIRYKRLEAGCNVYNDADDTAVAFSALSLYHRINPEKSIKGPESIGPIFSPHRDIHRPIPHFYNARHLTRNTGAFLTWLEDEKILNPLSYIPSPKRPYLPFGQNDVDCVVNSNVLSALASYGELDTPGTEKSCEFIHWAFKTGRSRTCGVYYPSPFNAHYTVAKAFHSGARCLKPAIEIALREILRAQKKDGSWASPIPQDHLHTSLYALNALLYVRETESSFITPQLEEAIEKGIHFVLKSQTIHPDGSISWKPGAFFSGGTFSRFWIYWRSEPYTTALAADALSLYL